MEAQFKTLREARRLQVDLETARITWTQVNLSQEFLSDEVNLYNMLGDIDVASIC